MRLLCQEFSADPLSFHVRSRLGCDSLYCLNSPGLNKMAQIAVKQWAQVYFEPLTDQAIRRLFVPSGNYRISEVRRPVGSREDGSMHAGSCFVLAGGCQFGFKAGTVTLREGG